MSTPAEDLSQQPILLREDGDDGITRLTLNRPKQYNALSENMLDQLQATLDDLNEDSGARVIVLGGTGKAFCAGHDLKEMRSRPDEDYYRHLFSKCSKMMLTMTQVPQPIIARVHGLATAAGCQLVAMADLAVAASSATFATSGINVGLFCSTPGVAVSRNLLRKHAMEMLITGDFVDADAAAKLGLVNRVAEDDRLEDEVTRLAQRISSRAPVAVRTGKRMFYKQIEKELEAAYAYAAQVMACNMMAEDTSEGIDAFIEKREPVWRGG